MQFAITTAYASGATSPATTAALAAALHISLDAAGRTTSPDARAAVLLELAVAAVAACAEANLPPPAAARAASAVVDLAHACAAAPAWPPLDDACAAWAASLRALTADGDGAGSGADADAHATDALADAALALFPTTAPDARISPRAAAALDAWLRTHSLLAPHIYALHAALAASGGASASPQRAVVVRPVVVAPPPRDAMQPLARARALE